MKQSDGSYLPGRRPRARWMRIDTARILKRFFFIESDYACGEGIQLQLRSAVSHLNEVWAVETGGAILQAFADDLEWEYIYDVARWTYAVVEGMLTRANQFEWKIAGPTPA